MEYMGSKLPFSRDDEGKGTVKCTQPVLIKKTNDEYKMTDGLVSKTPDVAGQLDRQLVKNIFFRE